MDTLKPTLKTRLHEWLAHHVSWIQYPKHPVYRQVEPKPPRERGSPLIWLLAIIPVPFLFSVPLVLIVYLWGMYDLYRRWLTR
ncbi:hypothetical protein [Herbaspirillum sp. YR522]|uniref:hypothetical protein n=1 Tax=Herbaspirillum sp. YR522 TaxID=1144342 RepID=UPI00026FAAEC|nr:hypothetical protein [Herbaspirillum sp. YR522]EJN07785.1 hypothetical protein PMI40_01681 [Herbaspirillum sp. YR522]